MSNKYPWFVGAKLKLVGNVSGLLLPDKIKEELENGLIIEISGISDNGCPRFVHNLGLTTMKHLEWSLIDIEASCFELVNPRINDISSPVYVSDLHPKDIALIQAMYIINRVQKRLNGGIPINDAGPSEGYLHGNFMKTPLKHIKLMVDVDDNFMNDLTINYHLKEVR